MSHVQTQDIYGNTYEVALRELRWRPAAYAIVMQDDEILLTKQHGKYSLPGGGVEFGESPEQAALRETQEETGLTVTEPQLVSSITTYFSYMDRGAPQYFQSLLLYYRCQPVGGVLSTAGFTAEEQKVGEMPEWVSLSALATIEAGGTVDWRAVVRQHLAEAR